MAEDRSQPATPTPKRGPRRRKPRAPGPSGVDGFQQATNNVGDAFGGGAGENQGYDADGPDAGPSSEDDEMLMDLLGVQSPPPSEQQTAAAASIPGLLAVSRQDLNESRGKQKNGGRKNKSSRMDDELDDLITKEDANGASPVPTARKTRNRKAQPKQEDSTSLSEGEAKRRPGKPSGDNDLTASNPVSSLSASRPKSGKSQRNGIPVPPKSESSKPFEMLSLSQSLPTSGFMAPSKASKNANGKKDAKGKGKKEAATGDESLVWDMPDESGPNSNQALTWQQQLQSTGPSNDSPRRSKQSTPQSGSTNSERKSRSRPGSTQNMLHMPNPPSAMTSSPLVPRPAHARRQSADGSTPISRFDDTIPFHTGFNVNRAPQTPAKLPTNMTAATSLPIVHGEFPRIKGNGGAKGPLANLAASEGGAGQDGIKYAGPTFHNSPHAASLPKPDMDDF